MRKHCCKNIVSPVYKITTSTTGELGKINDLPISGYN
jgi:hypothetical protein